MVIAAFGPNGFCKWITFYGSAEWDEGQGIVVDNAGNLYVTGESRASWNGDCSTTDKPIHPHSGGIYSDVVILKLTTDGQYVWHTFYGSDHQDVGYAVSLDSNGYIYVTGGSDASWNGDCATTDTPLHERNNDVGSSDIFVLKLSTDGEYQWHTFYGANSEDEGRGIVVDSASNVYITGFSDFSWKGPNNEEPLNAHKEDRDIIVLKLSANGQYRWHTFYGSNDWEEGGDIAIDSIGNIYITGESCDAWNGPNGEQPIHQFEGEWDIFVLKLDVDGQYQWHTFYLGRGRGDGIAVDNNGNVYVTGHGDATWTGPNGQSPLNKYQGGFGDIVVLKLGSDGRYLWHTFYGSKKGDLGRSVAVDSTGNVYVVAESEGSWDGPDGENPVRKYADKWDMVLLKLGDNGVYQWHTFCGLYNDDEGYAIALDRSGNIYVTGYSDSYWDDPDRYDPIHYHSHHYDVFVLKLSENGRYLWCTFYGCPEDKDVGYDIAIGPNSNVYVTGYSRCSWRGPGDQNPLNPYNGDRDIFVLKLNSEGQYLWHTFYGSNDWDEGRGIAVDNVGNVYVTGVGIGSWDGPGPTEPLHAYNDDFDIVVLKLNSAGQYQWHTFYGSTDGDGGFGISLDQQNNIYVTGRSWNAWDGPKGERPRHDYTGNDRGMNSDIVVLKLNSDGQYEWHTFYGSPTNYAIPFPPPPGDYGWDIAVDSSGNVYVVGDSDNNWQGPNGEIPLHAYEGSPGFDSNILLCSNWI